MALPERRRPLEHAIPVGDSRASVGEGALMSILYRFDAGNEFGAGRETVTRTSAASETEIREEI